MALLDIVRRKLRAWLGIVDVAPAPTIESEAKRQGISIASAVLQAAGQKINPAAHRRVQAPKLPPGVVPSDFTYDAQNDPGGLGPYVALDSAANASSFDFANQFACGLGFPGYAYLAELSQRSEYRAASETIASEMTREWVKIVVKGKAKKQAGKSKPGETEPTANDEDANNNGQEDQLEDKVQQLTEAMEKFKVREAFRKIAELDGLFGRAQLYIKLNVKGRNEDDVRQLPLCIDKATVPKGSLCGFKVIEPIWTTPYNYNATDPTADDFYKPKAWYVLGKRTHATRLLTFISREVSDILKPAYNFGGLSMTQLMESDVFQWLRTRNSVSDLVHNFSVMCLQTDMTSILSGEPDKPGGLMDRVRMFIATRDNQGLTVLDKDREAMAAVNVPLAGLDKLQAQAQEHQAAPSHIPLVKLLGVTPTGLNASSEGEIKVFNDFVRACQQLLFAPGLNVVLQLLQLDLFGAIDDAIGFEFVELTTPTVKELAEIRKSDAERDATYIDKGVLDPMEVRERVGSDPDSGYNNLSAEAPEPPVLPGTEAELALQQQGAEADHARSEESAEAAHARTLKEQAAASKAA